jgi:hypothetical protein
MMNRRWLRRRYFLRWCSASGPRDAPEQGREQNNCQSRENTGKCGVKHRAIRTAFRTLERTMEKEKGQTTTAGTAVTPRGAETL